MSPADNKQFLTPTEVATLLRVSPITVRQWAQKGKLHATVTPGGHRRFLSTDIETFAKTHGLTFDRPSGPLTTILIVDDDTQFAGYLAEQLIQFSPSIQIEVAHDGFTAGRMVQTLQPEIVLLDLCMPGLDGVQVCHQIKREPTLGATRVIAMTGFAAQERIALVLAAGAERCLAKPFDTETLRQALGLRVDNTQLQAP